MNSLLGIFAAIAVLLTIVAGPSYFFDILHHRTKPQRITWLIFSIIGAVAFVSQLQLGGRLSIIFVGVDALGSIATFILSLKYGVGGWGLNDKIALTVAATGIIISILSHEPIIALVGVILADISAVILTVVKTYRDPDSESLGVWIMVGMAAIFSALSVGKLDLNLLLFPVYLAIANLAVPIAKITGKQKQLRLKQV